MATHEVTRPLALNVTALEIAQALQDVIVTTPVVDNLTTNDGSKALSAKMGKKLNDEKFPIANIASALGQDVDKVPSNKVVDDAINAITAYDDSDYVDLMSSITILSSYISIDKFKMKRKGDIVFVCLYGTWSGTPSAATNIILSGIPSKYCPTKSIDVERTFCGLAYGEPPVQTARVRIETNGELNFPENNFTSGAYIRIYGCYCL